ncbi:MAG: hypothetical protein MUC57_10810 [Desulfobacterales bacterium]|nr:hypothetical protein [Desulfobacterales bacterium]
MKKKTRSVVILFAMVLLGLVLISCATTPASTAEKAEQQASIRDMANKALSDLYAKNPATKAEIAKAAGYAVFSDFGIKGTELTA